MSLSVVVVGAGIAGLTSAVNVQRELPTAQVTVVADKFSPHVTSDVAAGIWRPYLVEHKDSLTMMQIMEDSFSYIASLVGREGTGAIWQSGYDMATEELQPPPYARIVKGFRTLDQQEMNRFGHHYKTGWFYTTLGLETTTYLRYIMNQFLSKGGRVEQKRLHSLRDIPGAVDLIINCSGLGSRELASDAQLRPVRGQVVRVRAPSVKHFFIDGENYVLLNRELVILGATHDEDQWDTTVNRQTAEELVERNTARVPELKEAEIVSHQVGLRPYRGMLRLEADTTTMNDGRKVCTIHNYGHGGGGISIAWGCAVQVASLAKQHLQRAKL